MAADEAAMLNAITDAFNPTSETPSIDESHATSTESGDSGSVEPTGGADEAAVGGYGVHPTWDGVLAQIPAEQRAAVVEQIKKSDGAAQAEIQKARAARTPEEWQGLLDSAKENGVDPDSIIDAYNQQQALIAEMTADPDAFIADMKATVDTLVAAGTITRKEGERQKVQIDETVDDLLTDEQKEINELKAWRQKKEQEELTATQQRQQEAQRQQIETTARAEADTFMSKFDEIVRNEGFVSVGADGKTEPIVPMESLHQIASTAAAIIDADARISPEQALAESVRRFKAQVAAFGGQLPTAQSTSRKPTIPVIGGPNADTAEIPQRDHARTTDERETDMLGALLAMRDGEQ